MNTQPAAPMPFRPEPRLPLHEALEAAARLSRRLQEEGVTTHSAFDNGRRMVLLIDRAPKGLHGVRKRIHPNGMGGTTELYGAALDGCQLEWTVDIAEPASGVAHA